MSQQLIGLLLGTEEDWPAMFERMFTTLDLSIDHEGETHTFDVERIMIEPFDLRSVPDYDLVVDRLAHWYYQPREWLKKVALMDDVYLLNNPFTFQSMEKHSAYCMLMRLGLKVPDTWLVPTKAPVDNDRYPGTSSRYNKMFDLGEVAEQIGYPLFMKPFDGGAWVGVNRITGPEALHAAYDESGGRLMHLQASVEGFEAFARSLTIGPETMIMRFDPDKPMHERYEIDHDFLSAEAGQEVLTISRTVNALFRWEFNSCECLVLDGDIKPIDYANACPDVSLISLGYYFPWAISRLVKWSIYCTVTGRKMKVALELDPWFEVADDPDLSYEQKLTEYDRLSREYFDLEAYEAFCEEHLSHVDDVTLDIVTSDWFDEMLVRTVEDTFPEHERDEMVARYRGLTGAWAKDQAGSKA